MTALVKLTVGTSSYVTKSRIFKNLILRRKADRNFRDNLLKKHFRQLKFYSNPPSWLAEVVVIWVPFEIQKAEVHIFERVNLSGFATWEFAAKEDLNPENRYFYLIYDSGSPRNQNFGLFSMAKSLYEKILWYNLYYKS